MSITIHQGSILDSTADAIVNPANSFLQHGGGLAAVIARAARGPEAVNPGMDAREWFSRDRTTEVAAAWNAEQRDHPLVATGNAGVTSAGALPYQAIIHAVGPIWNGGAYMEGALLYLAHASALRVAAEYDADTIAFPAISCGIFGFPVTATEDTPGAAYIAMQAAQTAEFVGSGLDVEFWLFEDAHVEAYTEALDNLVNVV